MACLPRRTRAKQQSEENQNQQSEAIIRGWIAGEVLYYPMPFLRYDDLPEANCTTFSYQGVSSNHTSILTELNKKMAERAALRTSSGNVTNPFPTISIGGAKMADETGKSKYGSRIQCSFNIGNTLMNHPLPIYNPFTDTTYFQLATAFNNWYTESLTRIDTMGYATFLEISSTYAIIKACAGYHVDIIDSFIYGSIIESDWLFYLSEASLQDSTVKKPFWCWFEGSECSVHNCTIDSIYLMLIRGVSNFSGNKCDAQGSTTSCLNIIGSEIRDCSFNVAYLNILNSAIYNSSFGGGGSALRNRSTIRDRDGAFIMSYVDGFEASDPDNPDSSPVPEEKESVYNYYECAPDSTEYEIYYSGPSPIGVSQKSCTFQKSTETSLFRKRMVGLSATTEYSLSSVTANGEPISPTADVALEYSNFYNTAFTIESHKVFISSCNFQNCSFSKLDSVDLDQEVNLDGGTLSTGSVSASSGGGVLKMNNQSIVNIEGNVASDQMIEVRTGSILSIGLYALSQVAIYATSVVRVLENPSTNIRNPDLANPPSLFNGWLQLTKYIHFTTITTGTTARLEAMHLLCSRYLTNTGIAFIRHLFVLSTTEYSRVISLLSYSLKNADLTELESILRIVAGYPGQPIARATCANQNIIDVQNAYISNLSNAYDSKLISRHAIVIGQYDTFGNSSIEGDFILISKLYLPTNSRFPVHFTGTFGASAQYISLGNSTDQFTMKSGSITANIIILHNANISSDVDINCDTLILKGECSLEIPENVEVIEDAE
jgi:hypothetical protein